MLMIFCYFLSFMLLDCLLLGGGGSLLLMVVVVVGCVGLGYYGSVYRICAIIVLL